MKFKQMLTESTLYDPGWNYGLLRGWNNAISDVPWVDLIHDFSKKIRKLEKARAKADSGKTPQEITADKNMKKLGNINKFNKHPTIEVSYKKMDKDAKALIAVLENELDLYKKFAKWDDYSAFNAEGFGKDGALDLVSYIEETINTLKTKEYETYK